jgi:replication factor C small subunit
MNYWPEKYRPKALDEVCLAPADRELLAAVHRSGEVPNLLFAGTPGTGKTTCAKIIVNDILKCQYLYINASDESGIDTIRQKVVGFSQTESIDGKLKVVILDEGDGISGEAQRALRSVMEMYTDTTRFVLTCNYLHKIILPLQSRCKVITLSPPLEHITHRVVHVLKSEGIVVPTDQKTKLIEMIRSKYPDLRKILNELQSFCTSGTLFITDTQCNTVANTVYQMIKGKQKPEKVRRFTIESEGSFANDYQQLLKQLFEIYNEQDTSAEKTSNLLTLSEHLYSDAIVIDKEINFYACCIKLIAAASNSA